MKQTFIILLVTIFLQAYSQENDSTIVIQSSRGRLSGLVNIQNLNEDYNSLKFEGHWEGIEFGINGFADADYSMYPTTDDQFLDNDILRSNVLNLNLLQYSRGIQQVRNNIGLVTGLGLSFKSYHLNSNTTITLDENKLVRPTRLYYDSNQKSKLSLFYLEMPILLELQIPVNHVNNRFYISAGIIGSKRLESHTKIKYRKNGKKEKLKSPGDYSTNDYKLAATLRLGYRSYNLFFSYDLIPLFEDRKGPVLHPWSAGLRLVSF